METQTENIGRILHRVIKWSRDDITIDADQRRVTEMLKDLDLERANHAATPCIVERKKRDRRSDGCKGENQCEQGQCQTKHDWDDASDGDNKKSADDNDQRDDVNDSTKY